MVKRKEKKMAVIFPGKVTYPVLSDLNFLTVNYFKL